MLEIHNLACKRYDRQLFSNFSLQVLPKSFFQIWATNGLGKTTLLKTLAGLIPVYKGKINRLSKLLYIGHKTNLHPNLNPMQNLLFICSLNGEHKIKKEQIKQALKNVGLTQNFETNVCELSAGQAQRINIARLSLTTARLWLLDEPLVNLDEAGILIFLQLCQKHLDDNGAIILATHNTINIANSKVIQLSDYV